MCLLISNIDEIPSNVIFDISSKFKINKNFNISTKIVNIFVPLKVKIYIDKNFGKEVNHFKKKYKLEFNIIADDNQIIPEYKIDLLNKNKKIIKKIENIEKISSKDDYNKKFINKKFNKRFNKRFNKGSKMNNNYRKK